ncbi:MAG: TonB-dependent receptor [Alistipes sp.]|nr:TonB-dependent receptor [Alistipes sp.]
MKHVLLSISGRFGKVLTGVLCAVALLAAGNVSAQTRTITGKVIDAATKAPMPGAAIVVKGSSTGTAADANGQYTISASATDVLECSFFGYTTAEVTVGNRSVVDFAISESSTAIDELVVVGYGTLKKAQLVGAVENLGGEELEGRATSNVSRTLQGMVPGLNIMPRDGKPTQGGEIYIRGGSQSVSMRTSTGSGTGKTVKLGQGGSALVLIDGVEGDLNSVNPEDVENISVLKDAASASVYGARGAYGVILVTTKTPSKDKVTISYNGSVSLNTRTIKWEDNLVSDGLLWLDNFTNYFQNDSRTPTSTGKLASAVNNRNNTYSAAYHEEFRKRKNDPTYENYGKVHGIFPGTEKNYAYYGSTNWVDLFYRDMNTSHTHNLSVAGSSERVKYSISGRYHNQDGIYEFGNEQYNAYNLRAKGEVKVFKWLTLGNNTSIYHQKYHQPMVTGGAQPILRQFEHRGQPIYTPYNEDGTLSFYGAAVMYGAFSGDQSYQENLKMYASTTTTLVAEPIKDVLKISGDFTYKANRNTQLRVSPIQSGYNGIGALETYNNSSYKSDWRYNTDYLAANAVLTWTPKLGKNHDLSVMAGWNIESTKYRRLYLQRLGLMDPNRPSFELMDSQGYSVDDDGYDHNLVGVFARINYSLLGRYIFEFAGRYDGESRFPSNQRWGFFPSGSIGWRIAEEPWMEWSRDWLDNFKVRANVGSLGNSMIDDYAFMDLWAVDKTSEIINGQKVPYVTTNGMVSGSLTWETITTYDLGLDLDFLGNRLSFSGDLYWKYTTNMLTAGPDYPAILGENSPMINYGSLKTKGWEAALTWRDNFKAGGKDFNYSIRFAVWDSRMWIHKFSNESGNIYNFYEGMELGDVWGCKTAGYFLSNEEAMNWATDSFHKNGSNFKAFAGDLKFVDINGDGKIDTGKGTLDDHGDLTIIGNERARYHFGVNLNGNWNGIGLSIFLQGVMKRNWYPDQESGFFWGMYNRPYGYLPKAHVNDRVEVDYSTENWVVTNPGAYYTRAVAYAANRNVGPLAYENDYYLQDVSYLRVKNITLDYTFPSELTKKWHIEKLKVYFTAENPFTFSKLYKHTKMFDPEVIGAGDTDFNDGGKTGLDGSGQGYSYPMLKTFTFGLNITF